MNGKWAVITGASSGIGKALAFEFAHRGFNVFLTGRNEQALKQVASDCAANYGVESDWVAGDLARPDALDNLIAALSSNPRPYEILVNNAGFGVYGDFVSTDIEQDIQLLNVQLTAALRLIKAVVPSMVARRNGKVLNVASVYSFAPVPFQSVYSASKAFLLSFSSSLHSELSGTGVTVTVFCPGITQTEFRSRAGIHEKRRMAGMTAAAAAKIACAATLQGKHLVIPGFWNRMFCLVAKMLPGGLVSSLVRFINRKRGQRNE